MLKTLLFLGACAWTLSVSNAVQGLYYPYIEMQSSAATFNTSLTMNVSIASPAVLRNFKNDQSNYNLNKYKLNSVNFSFAWKVEIVKQTSSECFTDFVALQNNSLISFPANSVELENKSDILMISVNVSVSVVTTTGVTIQNASTLQSLYDIVASQQYSVTLSQAVSSVTGSMAPCSVLPTSGEAYQTQYNFFCTDQAKNSRMSVSIVKGTEEIQLISKTKSSSFSTIIPEGTWSVRFAIQKPSGQLISNYTLLNSVIANSSSSTCLLTAMNESSNQLGTYTDSTQAATAIDLMARLLLNDTLFQEVADSCQFGNDTSWRSTMRRNWIQNLLLMGSKYSSLLDIPYLMRIFSRISDSSITNQDLSRDKYSAVQFLATAEEALQNFTSLLSSTNVSDADEGIQSAIEITSNLWTQSSRGCNEGSIASQIEAIGNILSISTKKTPGRLYSSNSIEGVSSLVDVTDTTISVNGVTVNVPRDASLKCSNESSIEIVTSEFQSGCRKSLYNQVRSKTFIVVVRDSSSNQECAVRNLTNPIVLEIDLPTSVSKDNTYSCGWFDEPSKSWKSDGCSWEINEKTLKCSCSHLTEFALLVEARKASEIPAAIDSVKVASNKELNYFYAGMFLVLFLVTCTQVKRIIQRVAPENRKIILPAHVIILLIISLRTTAFVGNMSLRFLKNLSTIAVLYWLSITAVLPVVFYFILASLCMFSWVQLYYVNIKNMYTEIEVQKWRRNFWFGSIITVFLMLVFIIAAVYTNLSVALLIYQAMMYIFASASMLLSLGFGVYGSLIFREIASVHRKLSGQRKQAVQKNAQISAATRTKSAGMAFCIFWGVSGACWSIYAYSINKPFLSDSMMLMTSLLLHSSEILMMLSCMWLYKNAVPQKSVTSKQSSNKDNSDPQRRASVTQVKRLRSTSIPSADRPRTPSRGSRASITSNDLVSIPAVTGVDGQIVLSPHKDRSDRDHSRHLSGLPTSLEVEMERPRAPTLGENKS